MTSTLFKLHRTLWWRTVKSNASIIIASSMIFLYGLLSALSMFFEITDPEALHAPVGLGMIAMLVLAMSMPANERQITEEAFRTLPIENLKPAMALSTVWTSRAMLCIFFSVLWAIVGFLNLSTGRAILFAIGMVFAAATTIIYMDVIAKVGQARKGLLGIIGGIGIIVMIFYVASMSNPEMMDIPLEEVGAFLAWTPFAAATGWATGGIVKLLIALATIALGVWLWWRDIEQAPVQTKDRQKKDLRIAGLKSPAGIEFSRSFRYIFRDNRLLLSILVLPIVVIILVVQSITQDVPEIGFMAIAVCALLSGMMAVNDFGYDGPALWTKIVAPVPMYKLVLARHFAHMAIPTAFFVVFAVVMIAMGGGLAIVVALVSVGILLTSAALSLFLSTFNPYPVAAPGTSPWADKSGYSSAAFIAVFALMILGWLPVAPGIVLIVFGQLVAGVIVALLIPAAIYAGVIFAVKKTTDARMPKVYKKVGAWVR